MDWNETLNQLANMAIQLGTGLLILLIGWLIARLLSGLLARLLNRLGAQRLADRLNEIELLQKYKLEIKPVVLLRKFLFWIIMLITFMAAADQLGLGQVSELINQFIAFLPELLKAVVILLAGLYVASLVKNLVGSACRSFGIKSWNAIGNLVFFLLLVVVFISTLKQLQLETELLGDIIRILLGGVALAFGLAYGLAARNFLASLLTGFYSKNKYQIGQVIEIDGLKGPITDIDSMSITLDLGKELVVLPLNRLMNEAVKVGKEDERI
jgi:small-conductance mechanosensitive channel